jgi:inorganic pyrophosphatase
MNLWKDLETGPKSPDVINVVVEIPKGSKVKYKFKSLKNDWYLTLDRILYSPLFYAGNYGVIPQTMWERPQPLDCLVLMDESVPPQTVITARPIALLEMIDRGRKDDKVIAVAVNDPSTENFKDLKDLNTNLKNQISEFFRNYKKLEGENVEVLGWKDVNSAKKAVKHAQKVFNDRVR